MLRENLYFKMLGSICDAADSPLTPQEKADFNTAMGAKDFDGCFEQLDNHALPEKYKLIVDGVRYYKDVSLLGEQIDSESNVVFASFTDDIRKMHLRPMVYNSSAQRFFAFSSCSLLEENSDTFIDLTLDNSVWIGIEYIWNAIADNAADEAAFFQMLDAKDRFKVVFVTNLTIAGLDEESLFKYYSFAYLCYINENRFNLPQVLSPVSTRFVSTPLAINANNYDQYYDVYNALNDAKHATNILTQFVHIYQAIELLAYRMKMAKLVNSSSGMKQSAIKQLMAYAKTFREDESHSIINLFAKVFPGIENNMDHTLLANPCKSFLERNYGITYTLTTIKNDGVAKLVYQLRNSIVHNKDTELHFSFNNTEEYKVVIPVIKDLVKVLPEAIVNMLNDNNQARRREIEYSNRELKLY